MNNTCKTCTHWVSVLKSQSEWVAYEGGWSALDRNHLGECRSGKLLRVLDEDDAATATVKDWNKVPLDGLGAVDGSGYFVGILVGKDFGCIHHTTKEQSNDND